ncbi:MAG: ATP-binding protein [Muribaculaceae bacterium]|nr:ATP-binding protein [Muribaculaceae bacterium]
MKSEKYPIGLQTFQKIIESGYTYVDKTAIIPELLETGQYIFLSRPRRFGKSLLLSTLHSFFEGRRDLFRGLAIDSLEVEWNQLPVIHIDLNAENYQLEDGLDIILDRILRDYESNFEVTIHENSFASRFTRLIKTINEKIGKKVVILVDEYDKPLLNVENNPALFAKNQAILKGFFGVLKSMDRHIRFAMLTGVARFSKVSIFSDLNNLRDISLSDRFADICGISEKELCQNFPRGIEKMAKKNGLTCKQALENLRYYYDGYLFAEKGSRLYNPWSLLNALEEGKFGFYWFETGTPTFLVRRIRDNRMLLPALNSIRTMESDLVSIGMEDTNPIPLLFQTGYLTIKTVSGRRYELHFPNHEVECAFAEKLRPLYLPQMDDLNGEFSLWDFQDEILDGKPEQFMRRLQAMVKAVPYEQHSEKFYQNVVYLLFTLVGMDARVEEHTNIGRTDLVVRTKRFIYIFEFKYDGSPEEALRQIEDRDYAGRFDADYRKIFRIGANFSSSKRGLDKWIIKS